MEYASFWVRTESMQNVHVIASLSLSALLFSGPGEMLTPTIDVSEFPAEVKRECTAVPVGAREVACETSYQTRWLGNTPRGQLFSIRASRCHLDSCPTWFVEKKE